MSSRKKCPHNKLVYFCKECGGKGLCKHEKSKFACTICRTSGTFCKHNRSKYLCIECKGKGICKHNRIKYNCIDCGGKGICKHKRRKSYCIDCKGSQICRHNIGKRHCYTCRSKQKPIVAEINIENDIDKLLKEIEDTNNSITTLLG